MMGWQKDCGGTPRCKEMDWQSFKQEYSTFYFVRNHFESIGKPILLKGDEVLLNGLFAQVLSDSTPKPSTTPSTQICPEPTF